MPIVKGKNKVNSLENLNVPHTFHSKQEPVKLHVKLWQLQFNHLYKIIRDLFIIKLSMLMLFIHNK